MADMDGKSHDFLFEKNPLIEVLTRLGFYAQERGTRKRLCSDLWQSWGYDEKDMDDSRLREICHPDDRDKVDRFIDAVQSGAKGLNKAIFRIRAIDGRLIWIRRCGAAVTRDKDGAVGLYVGLDTDLAEFKETEESLRSPTSGSELYAKELESLLNAATIITSSLDVNQAVQLILEQAKSVIPYDKASVQLIKDGALELIGGIGFVELSAVIGLRFPFPEKGSMSTLAIEERRVIVCGDVARDRPDS